MKAEQVEELLCSSCLPLQQLGSGDIPVRTSGKMLSLFPQKRKSFANAGGASFNEEKLLEGRVMPGEHMRAAFGEVKVR